MLRLKHERLKRNISRDKHRKEVVHLTDKKAAPVEEQQISSPNDTTTNLADAIRLSCYANRIDHDVAESIVGGVFARYTLAPAEHIIRSVEPDAVIYIRHSVASRPQKPDGKWGRPMGKAQAERIAQALIATDPCHAALTEDGMGGHEWLKVVFDEYREVVIHYAEEARL